MWDGQCICSVRTDRFFFIVLQHNSLFNYYKLNFALMQHHNYSLSDIENMFPYELDIYSSLLIKHIEEENSKNENAQQMNEYM